MPKVDELVDRYRVEAELGVGGMATVYRVRHATLGSVHALKVLHVEGRGITERLLAEGRVQAGLDHPNALTVTDVIEVDGQPGLVMEYVDGGTLDEWVARESPSREVRLAVFRAACEAVASAHAKGWVHRDLKPANLLMKRVGDTWQPKVADFGLVKAVVGDQPHDGPATRQGIPMGTPGYMAPEQIQSAAGVDARADVYSLGCILVWLLTGRDAFEGDTMLDLFAKVAAGEHNGLPADDPLHAVVEKALAQDADARFPDAGALVKALDDPGVSKRTAANPTLDSGLSQGPGRAAWLGLGAGAMLAIGGLTGFVVLALAVVTLASLGGGTDCELGAEGRIGWVKGSSPSFTPIPSPYVLEAAATVWPEAKEEGEPLCTLPAGTRIEVRSRSRRLGAETFWVGVEGDGVELP
ncbi:MAG: serine/threonine protein kinase [Alphaproteobacteria bacterium]|nr:serine/threonine protein kinase [Alphaproteobacteria bacterium]